MKAIITDLGNSKRTSEEIKESGMLFFNRGEMTNDIAQAISDNDITTEGNIQLFFQEMGSYKDNYGYFIFNRIEHEEGNIIYDFLISIIDERIADVEFVTNCICKPMTNRFAMNSHKRNSYIKIGDNCCLIVTHTRENQLDSLIAKIICKK